MNEALVRQIAAARAATQPELAKRLERAVSLILADKVHLDGPDHATVDSGTEPGVSYAVNEMCACQDARQGAPNGWCAHRLAVDLARALPVLQPCPEAKFSACLRGRLGGIDAQLTARGQTLEEFKVNVAAIHAMFDAPTAAAPSPTAAARSPQQYNAAAMHRPVSEPPPEEWCPRHQTPMQLNRKEGRTWYSHRVEDGSWCKGK